MIHEELKILSSLSATELRTHYIDGEIEDSASICINKYGGR